nr:hypothetical protein orf31 [uncultured archaeon]
MAHQVDEKVVVLAGLLDFCQRLLPACHVCNGHYGAADVPVGGQRCHCHIVIRLCLRRRLVARRYGHPAA